MPYGTGLILTIPTGLRTTLATVQFPQPSVADLLDGHRPITFGVLRAASQYSFLREVILASAVLADRREG